MKVQNIDTTPVVIGQAEFEDGTLAFEAEDTYAAGTILGRKTTSADAYAGVITGTGTRVATLVARPGRSLALGGYGLLAGTLSSGVGPWTLTAPDGQTATFTSSAAADDLLFPALGVNVEVGAGTNYVTADSVAFTVAAGSKFAPFDPSGSNGAQEPKAVLTHAVSRESAGDESVRPLVQGKVAHSKLVIHGGGSVTPAISDALRGVGITPLKADTVGRYDNQPA